MKKSLYIFLLVGTIAQWGCSGAFWGGAATGALATGAGYEINNKRQMDRLEDDYNGGRISRDEYLDRKNQIEHGSVLY